MASGVTLTGLTVAAAATTTGATAAVPLATASSSASASATASASASPSASAAPTPAPTLDQDGLLTQPRANCLQFPDPAGDASLVGSNDDDLDLTGVVYETTSSALRVFVKEAALSTGPSSPASALYDGHVFSTTFVIGGRTVVLSASSAADPSATVTGGPTATPTATPTASATATPSASSSASSSATPTSSATATPTATASSGGGLPGLPGLPGGSSATPTSSATPSSGATPTDSASASATPSASPSNGGLTPTATFDQKSSTVVFSVPRLQLAQLVGSSVYGTTITGLSANSTATSAVPGFPAMSTDDAAPTKDSEKAYRIGDNTCFLPPPATASLSGLTATYTDGAAVVGILRDAAGAPLPNATLTLRISGLAARNAVTDRQGRAVFRFKETLRSGRYGTALQFAGTAVAGKARAAGVFVTAVESTVVRAAATTGLLTATLVDNDNAPIVRRLVTFTVGTRRFNVVTDLHGKALLRGVRRGTTVKVSFAAVPTLYSAARTVAVVAR